MAEIVSAVITLLCEKLISEDLIKLARSEGIDTQLKKLKKALPLIESVLVDACNKQITNRSIQLWVNTLHDLAYDIDDLLDDLATEAMRSKLNQESHATTSTSKVLKLFPTFTKFSPRSRMSSKLDEITTKLDSLVEGETNLGLNVYLEESNRTEKRFEEVNNWSIEESLIIGRAGDKKALMRKLLQSVENVSIVSIVGKGGIGKTTLAKVLYNEEKLKNHFELRAWVCVTEKCNVVVFNISKSDLEAVSGEAKRFSNLDQLHVALKEKLSNKRFLLVLDDVWNEDHSKWELLQNLLLVGAPGSKVIVTTRITSVVGSNENYHLEVLSNEDALSLFAQHTLGEKNFDNHPTLKLLAEGMIQKCGRLPLALKALGRVLKGNRNGDEWEKLLKSEIWDIEDGSEILPALRLSYNHLPQHLKQLFAYCSLFPRGYVFDKKKLVLLWMAEGFLSQSIFYKTQERLGNQYFEELKSRSFFQYSTNDELGLTMHDLISDLATSVAGEFFFRSDDEMDVSNTNETFEKLRHFSLISPQAESYKKLKELQRSRRLRTFLLMSSGWKSNDLLDNFLVELLPDLQFLRVLSLSSRNITKIPQSIGNLKHLRYLNFSNTRITCLPEQVSELYNLQSLLVSGCYVLSALPKSFAKLINLRHLDISRTPKLNKTPLGIGSLTGLQTLPKVVIDRDNGFKISDLKDLRNLQGQLSIMGLDKVKNRWQAKDANLHEKEGLDVLDMEWSDVFDDYRNEIIIYEILEGLRPHHKLRTLKIFFYKGMRFPSWVGDPSFDQLTEITLCGCRSIELPTLGHLPSLGKLFVKRMNKLETVHLELLATTDLFPSLKILKFDDMQSWKGCFISVGNDDGTIRQFPCLRELSIKRCPRLAHVSIGLIPSLRVLHVEGCSEQVLRSIVGATSSLIALKMLNVKGLAQLDEKDLMRLGVVEDLYIDRCDELRYLWEPETEAYKVLRSLKKLEVRNCDTLESLICPNHVERLVISCCRKMTSLTFSPLVQLLSSISISDCDNIEPIPERGFVILSMSSLRSLDIHGCENLTSFPHEHLQSLTSLEDLFIRDCPSMDNSFSCGLWPPNLRSLGIGYLNKPMSEWGPLNFPTSLVQLLLYGENSGVVSFAVAEHANNTSTSCFLLPPSLASLGLNGFMDVESLSDVLQHLPGLKTLHIWSCPKLRDLPETTSSLTVKVWL
ncbi:unnamed protein product [Lactuca saligna]|uniref:Uncharacterized protein n=1 Tax=Lactuca saligna TaxID=75948 RepID=A0AA35VCP2_LACSI|nr:unnamed protein product [Lactuca saligna]